MNAPALVIGSSGYIGGSLADALCERKIAVSLPVREDLAALSGSYGTVFYCAGVTGDFYARRYDTVDAHVATVLRLVRSIEFESFVYLSSTRVYGSGPTHEESELRVRSLDASDLYNISKLAGEAIVLQSLAGRGKVARLSNVVGPAVDPTSFIGSLATMIRDGGPVRIEAGPSFERDYVDVRDVVKLLLEIPGGRDSIYNIASGSNVSNGEIAELIRESGRTVTLGENTPALNSPIDVSRIRREFAHTPLEPRAALSLALGIG